jgi:hypothetical protein
MLEILLAIVLFTVSLAGLSAGLLAGRGPLEGGCGRTPGAIAGDCLLCNKVCERKRP